MNVERLTKLAEVPSVAAKRWYETGPNLRKRGMQDTCECCGKELNAARMLELDQRTNTYHDLGGVPDNKSQGWFPFGLTCAKRKVAEHRARIRSVIPQAPM